MTDYKAISAYIKEQMTASFIPAMEEFVRVPNLTRLYDDENDTNGLTEQACNLAIKFARDMGIKNIDINLVKKPGKTCLVFGEVPATNGSNKTTLVYGHLDKQPHLEGWMEGTGPINPAIIDGKLYGRGTADDGYSFYAFILILKALQKFGVPHDRFVLFFETDEESASIDVPFYLEDLKKEIGDVNLVYALDSGTIDYEHFTITSSLRGSILGTLSVKTISDGVHSGMWAGLIPDTFRIARNVLSRLEDSSTGVMPEEFHVDIPADKYAQMAKTAAYQGKDIHKGPFLEGVQPLTQSHLQTAIYTGWIPALTVTGADGLPATKDAGNVLRPETKLIFSSKMPPTRDGVAASLRMKEILEENSPYGAHVKFDIISAYSGWNAPVYSEKFLEVINKAAAHGFGAENEVLYMAMGGSIPVVKKLCDVFPNAQCIVTGVLGPNSNAHCPNEFLHLAFVEKLINTLVFISGEGPVALY